MSERGQCVVVDRFSFVGANWQCVYKASAFDEIEVGMKLERVDVRFYKSFNFDYELKAKDERKDGKPRE